MKQICGARVLAAHGITSLCLFLLALAANAGAQTHQPAPPAPAFEVVSFKHTGNIMDGGRNEGGTHYFRPQHGPTYKGVKLSVETTLGNIISYAYSPLVKPGKLEYADWIYSECYDIEAIAPAGATTDGALAMLRTVLVERLGLKSRLVDRDTPIYALVRGNGALKLTPSTQSEPNPRAHRMGAFKNKSASLSDFARFLSSLTDREVYDRTGIQGQFQFDVDWTAAIQDTMHEFGPHGDPTIVFKGAKDLGLKLEPRKEAQKIMVIDHLNREPTPN